MSVRLSPVNNQVMPFFTMMMMGPLGNLRHAVSDATSIAAVTAPDHQHAPCHGRQLAPWPAPVALQTSAAHHALASTAARTGRPSCLHQQWQHSNASFPAPARPLLQKSHQRGTTNQQLLRWQWNPPCHPRHPSNQQLKTLTLE
jgi:hypothetical protein